MAIDITDKALALLIVLRPDEIRAAPSVTRRKLAEQCRRVAALAEPAIETLPKSGVLADLGRGVRSD